MIYHNIYDSWAWTGGHCDGDSDVLHVALKEAEEETGINNLKLLSDGIYGIQILTVDSHIKNEKFISSHLHLDCCFLFEANEEFFTTNVTNAGASTYSASILTALP